MFNDISDSNGNMILVGWVESAPSIQEQLRLYLKNLCRPRQMPFDVSGFGFQLFIHKY